MSLNTFGEDSAKCRAHKGFYTPSRMDETEAILAKLMLITTEVAEAAEAVRKGDLENFKEEIADIIIRTVDLGWTMDVDLDEAVEEKMHRNWLRKHKHGKRA